MTSVNYVQEQTFHPQNHMRKIPHSTYPPTPVPKPIRDARSLTGLVGRMVHQLSRHLTNPDNAKFELKKKLDG